MRRSSAKSVLLHVFLSSRWVMRSHMGVMGGCAGHAPCSQEARRVGREFLSPAKQKPSVQLLQQQEPRWLCRRKLDWSAPSLGSPGEPALHAAPSAPSWP